MQTSRSTPSPYATFRKGSVPLNCSEHARCIDDVRRYLVSHGIIFAEKVSIVSADRSTYVDFALFNQHKTVLCICIDSASDLDKIDTQSGRNKRGYELQRATSVIGMQICINKLRMSMLRIAPSSYGKIESLIPSCITKTSLQDNPMICYSDPMLYEDMNMAYTSVSDKLITSSDKQTSCNVM